eukprot:CCRYP_004116-RA/>CCRYP_004116-RA protein AED:0.40 eAED:0.40 QI:0/-1/0/1/-1/1/1/0/271
MQKKTSSSPVKERPYSLECAMPTDAIAFQSSKHTDNGSPAILASMPKLPSTTPTVSMTYLLPNRPSNSYMPYAATPSSPPGSRPSRPATSIDGCCSRPQTYSNTTLKPAKHPRGTSTRPTKMFAPPNGSNPSRNYSQTNSGAAKNAASTKVYNTRETIFTDQTSKFPTRSQTGHQYIMIMVKIDSSTILIEPIKNRKDAELTRAYTTLMSRLHRAGIQPRKHILGNEISQAMKDLIRDKYRMQYKPAPLGCHRRNAAEVAIRNFKATSSVP